MLDQQGLAHSALRQQKYDNYAKPVLLSQPEAKQKEREACSDCLLHSRPKTSPGKLSVTNFQRASEASTALQESCSATLSNGTRRTAGRMRGSAGKGSSEGTKVSPRILELHEGLLLSRPRADSASKTAGEDGHAAGQIAIVAQVIVLLCSLVVCW
jgi:hypothetical protein